MSNFAEPQDPYKSSRPVKHVYQTIHAPIDIAAKFINGKWQISHFRWNNQVYRITEQCLVSKAMRGISPVWFFSVLTEQGSYQLRLDTDTLHWWIEEVLSEYT